MTFLRTWRFRLATECCLSSVGRALTSWSRGPGFNPTWGNFWRIFFALPCVKICHLSDNLTETLIVKNSNIFECNKGISDKHSNSFVITCTFLRSQITLWIIHFVVGSHLSIFYVPRTHSFSIHHRLDSILDYAILPWFTVAVFIVLFCVSTY